MTAGLVTAPKASLTKLLAAYLREPSPRHSLIGSHLLPWTAWPLPTAWLPIGCEVARAEQWHLRNR